MMQGWAAPPPARAQPYSVACAEGHRLQGRRTEGYQALRCPTCGDGIFVLPRSPLPEPPLPTSPTRSRVAAAVEAFPDDGPLLLTDPPAPESAMGGDLDPAVAAEVEIDWVDVAEPEAEPEPIAKTKPRPPAEPTAPAAEGRRPRSKPAPAPSPVGDPAPALRARLAAWAWGHRNSLLFAGVVLLVLVAVSVRRWRQRLEELPQIAEIGRTEGMKRLDAGDFQAAKKLLADAASAVDGLGGRYEGADAIRQGAREAAIFTDLAPESLEDILQEATTYRDVKDWSSHFADFYKGRSVILDDSIVATPDPNRPGSGYRGAYKVYGGRGPKPDAKARIDLAGFELLQLVEPKVGEPKIFGARLASLELDIATSEWVFTLEPDSGVFMTHPKALALIFRTTPEADAEEARP